MIHVPTQEEIERACIREIDVPKVLGLHPSIRARCVEHMEESRAAGVPFVVVFGFRSAKEQAALYAMGRDADGNDVPGARRVTWAKPWKSWHQYALAYDVALLRPDLKTVSWDEHADLDADGEADWLEVVEIGESLGLEAGFRWSSKKHDGGHFQFRPGLDLTAAWGLCVTGKPIPDDYFEKVA